MHRKTAIIAAIGLGLVYATFKVWMAAPDVPVFTPTNGLASTDQATVDAAAGLLVSGCPDMPWSDLTEASASPLSDGRIDLALKVPDDLDHALYRQAQAHGHTLHYIVDPATRMLRAVKTQSVALCDRSLAVYRDGYFIGPEDAVVHIP